MICTSTSQPKSLKLGLLFITAIFFFEKIISQNRINSSLRKRKNNGKNNNIGNKEKHNKNRYSFGWVKIECQIRKSLLHPMMRILSKGKKKKKKVSLPFFRLGVPPSNFCFILLFFLSVLHKTEVGRCFYSKKTKKYNTNYEWKN